jgi:hypothetical protein
MLLIVEKLKKILKEKKPLRMIQQIPEHLQTKLLMLEELGQKL